MGAAIAHRNPGVGALVGGAAGLITGGLIGHAMDQEARVPAYVPAPPPPPVYVAPPPPPARRYVWLNGQWVWNGAQWVWMPGHWVAAP